MGRSLANNRVRVLVASLVVLCLVSAAVVAQGLRCSQCGRQIRGKYLTSKGKTYCSQRCFEAELPRCRACGRRVRGSFLTSAGKSFCSESCFKTTLPACEMCGRRLQEAVSVNGHIFCRKHADAPACSKCSLPMREGKRLRDGRRICSSCDVDLVWDRPEALRYFREARDHIAGLTGIRLWDLPELRLVCLKEMPAHRRSGPSDRLVQRGLYRREETTHTSKNLFGWTLKKETTVERQILILYALGRDEFMSTAVHELTHDLLAEHFPQVVADAPQWVEEGICQYVAAGVCRKLRLHAELERVETCSHVQYGEGYRYIRSRAGDDNWPGVVEWLTATRLAGLPDSP